MDPVLRFMRPPIHEGCAAFNTPYVTNQLAVHAIVQVSPRSALAVSAPFAVLLKHNLTAPGRCACVWSPCRHIALGGASPLLSVRGFEELLPAER